MEKIYDKIEKDLLIDSELMIFGMIVGHVIIKKNGILVLNGTITKDLILEEGSRCDLYGTVSGNVINKGGILQVNGRIYGTLSKESGFTQIDPNAVIGTK